MPRRFSLLAVGGILLLATAAALAWLASARLGPAAVLLAAALGTFGLAAIYAGLSQQR